MFELAQLGAELLEVLGVELCVSNSLPSLYLVWEVSSWLTKSRSSFSFRLRSSLWFSMSCCSLNTSSEIRPRMNVYLSTRVVFSVYTNSNSSE